jgi:hypothetical protein
MAHQLSRNTMRTIDSLRGAVRIDLPPTVRMAHPTEFLRHDLQLRADYFANQTFLPHFRSVFGEILERA